MPAINEDQHFIIFAVMMGLVWFGLVIEKTRFGRITTGMFWTISLAIVLSNINVLPKAAPAYSFVSDYLVPLSIPLFLYQVNLRDIFMRSGRVMTAFLVGSVGTALGVLLGVLMLDLGVLEAKLAGVYAATYIGGSMNFVATSQALEFQEGAFLSSALAADNLAGNAYFLLLALAPASLALRRLFASEPETAPGGAPASDETPPGGGARLETARPLDERPAVTGAQPALAKPRDQAAARGGDGVHRVLAGQ